MALRDIFKRRQGLNAITGFNGGSLQDQIDQTMLDGQPGTGFDYSQPNQPDAPPPTTRPRMVNSRMPQPEPAQPNEFAAPNLRDRQQASPMADQPIDVPVVDDAQPTPLRNLMTRPRVATNPFYDRMMNDPTRQERPREVNPTDEVTKSADYVRQIHDKPLSLRDKFGLAAQNISTNLGGTPLATRRQRDLARAGEGLQRDLAVQGQQYKQQALESQIAARDATARASEERLAQGQSRLDQTALNQRRQRLISQHSSLKEFNPDDPKNAGFVASWTREFGYPPPKKVSGSLLQYNTGYDDKGNLVTEITDKGTGEVTQTTGSKIATTEQGATRKQSAAQFQAAEKGRNDRANARNAQSERNSTIVAGGQVARMGDPGTLKNNISEIDKDIGEIDEEIKVLTQKQQTEGLTREEADMLKSKPRERAGLKRERRDIDKELGKITSAQGNLSTRGARTSTPKYKTLSEVIDAFKKSPKNTTHRDPTATELETLKQTYQVQ